MPETKRIRQVRIDIPLKTTSAYLFVSPHERGWDPWWSALFEHLVRLAPKEPEWRFDSVQGVFIAPGELTDPARAELMQFLRTAPQMEVDGHRTLARAVKLSEQEEHRVEVMYFADVAREDQET